MNVIGKKCIVRTYSAGVHYGTVAEFEGKQVTLLNARRIWRWKGRFTLNEISLHGVGEGSQLPETVPMIILTEAIELLLVTDAAAANIEGFPVWKP